MVKSLVFDFARQLLSRGMKTVGQMAPCVLPLFRGTRCLQEEMFCTTKKLKAESFSETSAGLLATLYDDISQHI